MVAIIKQLFNKDKTKKLYPITKTKAVYDDDGNRLSDTIEGINENLNRITSYSTEEVEMGTWVDGKKYYSRVMETSVVGTSGVYVNVLPEVDIDILISLYAINTSLKLSIPLLGKVNGTVLQGLYPTDWACDKVIVTYTKN